MASAIKNEGNNLILTPNYFGGNLILPDSGIISQFAQTNPGYQEVVASKAQGSTVLHATTGSASTAYGYGVYCLLNEAIKKYGVGNYRLTFKVKSDKSVKLSAGVGYGMGSTSLNSTTVSKAVANIFAIYM